MPRSLQVGDPLKRLISVLILATTLVMGSGVAQAHPGHESSARQCGNTINASYIACTHRVHHHSQYRSGRGTRGHTWASYQREARQLRAYLLAVYVAAVRQQLVDRWSGVAQCESGGNWATNTGNGYYGGLQFSLSTWQSMGGRGYPNQQPAWYQSQIADNLRRSSGLHHWPVCGRYYG